MFLLQAAWPQQPDPHQGVVLQTTAVALGGHQQQHPQQQQHHHGQQGGPMLSTNASEPVAPDLPLPEDLKMLVQEGNGGNGSAIASPSGSLGHVMLVRFSSLPTLFCCAPDAYNLQVVNLPIVLNME